MREVAKRNDTTRFVKLHNSDAEMEEAGLPAILAYRRTEKVNQLVPLLSELPDDSELSAVSLETLFRRSVHPAMYCETGHQLTTCLGHEFYECAFVDIQPCGTVLLFALPLCAAFSK